MKAHRFIDTFRKAKGACSKIPETVVSFTDVEEIYAQLIEKAQKFEFRSMFVERNEEGGIEVPSLTADETEFWTKGLIPLPYELCWYEFPTTGGTVCLLVYEQNDYIAVRRFDHSYLDSTETISTNFSKFVVMKSRPGEVETSFDGYELQQQETHNFWKRVQETSEQKGIKDIAGAAVSMALFATLMINSRTVTRKIIPSPDKLNKKRVAAGKAPVSGHTVVQLIDKKLVTTEGAGTHSSPRLHWRRSHKRHYENPTPGSVWCQNEMHKNKQGWYVLVVPRHQVGSAALGEVTHEYRWM